MLSALKADRVLCDVPVVLLTISPSRDLGYLLGADEYVMKPFDPDQLAKLLAKYQLLDTGGAALVVDDDEVTRDVLRRLLTREGWVVEEAVNGVEALARLHMQVGRADSARPRHARTGRLRISHRTAARVAMAQHPVIVLTSKDLTNDDRLRLSGRVESIIRKGAHSHSQVLRDIRDIVSRHLTQPPRKAPAVRHLITQRNPMPKLLIVEDNQDNRDALSRRLERRGFNVLIAVDGQAGAETARAEHPDLILMDMNMPGIDGWEATRLVKSDPATADIPVIALTAHALAGDRGRALEAGCADYHTKPVDLAKLLTQIEEILWKSTGHGVMGAKA